MLSPGAPSESDCAALSILCVGLLMKMSNMPFRSKSPMLFFFSRGNQKDIQDLLGFIVFDVLYPGSDDSLFFSSVLLISFICSLNPSLDT